MPRFKFSPLVGALLLAASLVGVPQVGLGAAEPSAAHGGASHSRIFAVVNGREVLSQEYENAFASLVRQKFYHGQVPENEVAAAREEVKTRLVQRIVLLEEAARRGIAPDEAQVGEAIAAYDTRYAASPAWRESREKLLPGLRQQLEEQSLVSQLEMQVKKVSDPGDAEVKAFFDARPELFTEPEKIRLSIIALLVDPASPATAWDATREEARAIYKRLAAGADFSEAARMHSGAYAETGGDMGYLHRGMLPEALQQRVDEYALGRVNEPVDTLEGVAILRVDDRLPAKKREFSEVAQRARELLIRERQEIAWKALVQGLVASADVKFLQGPAIEPKKEGGQ